MPIIKRFNKYQGLRDIDVLVEEQGLSSTYFNITGVPSEIPQGKSSFLVGGSPFLKNNIELKIEMIDSNGKTIYMEPVSNYLEGGGRRVSIEVYPDTAPGIAQLYIVGELKNNYKSISEGQNSFDEITDVAMPAPLTNDVPTEFQGIYNVRYVMPVMVNTTIPNTEPIIFYKQPRLTVNEIVKGFVHEIAPSSSYDVSGSLSINVLQASQPQSPATSPEAGQPVGMTESDRNDVGKSLSIFKNRRSRKRDPFRNSLFGRRGRKMRRSSPEVDTSTGIINSVSKTPENSVNTISSTFVGETLNIDNITINAAPLQGQPFTITGSYTTEIKKVINNNTFVPMEDFTVTLMSGEKVPVEITNASFTSSIKPTPGFLISTTDFRSFADITIGNLRTFSGDVYKAVVYGKSKGSLGDFEPMYEAFIESPEVLVDKLSPTGFSSTAYFYTQSIVDAYWDVTNGTAIESDEVLIDGVTISGSNYQKSSFVKFSTKHLYDLEPNVSYNVEFNTYYYKENKEQADGSTSPDAIMEVYVTGSSAGNKELLGRVDVGEGNEGNINSIFKSFISAPRSPKLALEFHIKAGRFILQDLSVRPTSETNFNPDYHRVIVPMPHPLPVKPDQYDFVVEFFDVNNNIAETFANTENIEFDGAPLMISGDGNFLSGSMMLGTGMELYGGSAFLRTVGYRGFEHTLSNNKGGFMVFSGSIGGPSAPKNLITSSEDYDGVGLEIIDAHDGNNPRYLKFRTNPSTFEVITDTFYFGKQRNQTNAQFVSGAMGNIEISSSKLHLKPDGDIIVKKVTADEGNIGAFQIIDNMISGSNISFNATRSQIFKTDQGPGSDTSATFEEKRDEYYIDFTPSESIDKVNGYRPGYYIKMGPSFMVDKDGILIASGAVFEGTVSASKGIIGGFTTDENAFSSTGVFISGSALVGGVDDDKYKVISTANFNLKQNGDITGSNVLFTGGKIGGFTLGTNTFTATDFELDPSGKRITLGDNDDIFIADGDEGIQLGDATFADAPFSVTKAGVLKAESGTVAGWTLGTEALTGGEMIIRKDGTIESAGFASDVAGSGFRLTAAQGGYLEVENAKIRGTLATAVFEKETVNAVGGQLYVANSTSLTGSFVAPGGVHTATQETMSVENASGFVAGEILTIKKIHNTGFNTEYLLVDSSSRFDPSSDTDQSGLLFVQRGYGQGTTGDSGSLGGAAGSATSYSGSQVVVSTGRVGTGYIRLNANPSDLATPYIDIVERTGNGLYDIDLKARLGDLSGLSAARLHGTNPSGQFGLYSKNVFLEGGIVANTGSIAGIEMQDGKLFTGTGTHGGATTGFFASSSGDFSLKDKLVWDNSAGTLTLKGALRQTSGGTPIVDFINKGTWAAGVDYEINNLVQYTVGSNTSTYVAKTNHTSTDDNDADTGRPDQATNGWAVYAQGSTGSTGPGGASAKGLSVTLDSQTFAFDDSSDTSSTPTSILFSINQQNLTGTVTTSDITITDAAGSTVTNPTLLTSVTSGTGTVSGSLEFSSNLSGDKSKLPVTVSVSKDSITDSATIFKIEGGSDGAAGADGTDAYTPILTNESHVVGRDSTQAGGAYDLAGSGTEIIVFRGITGLTGSLLDPITGTYSASIVENNFLAGTPTIVDNKISFADMTANPTDVTGSITYTIHAEGSASFTKIQSLSVNQSADSGSDGSDGGSAKALIITTDASAYTFVDSSTSTAVPNSIKFTIQQQNLSATIVGSDITITDSSSNTISNPSLTTNVTNGSGTVTGDITFDSTLSSTKSKLPITISVSKDSITDAITIVKVEGGSDGAAGADGVDAYTPILTNETHVVGRDSTQAGGAYDLNGSGTELILFRGVTPLVGRINAAPTTGFYSASIVENNFTAGTPSIVSDKISFADMTVNPSDISGSITYTIHAEGSSSFTKIQSLSVNQSADSGSDGDPGTPGSSAKSVSLTSTSQVIEYSADGTGGSGTITLTATSQNFTDAYFKFTGGGGAFTDETSYDDGAGGANSDTATFTIPASYSSTPYTFTVSVQEGSSGGEVASDTLTIASIKPGTDGADGESAFTVISTNEAHTIPQSSAQSGGAFNLVGSGTDIFVYKGITQLSASSFHHTLPNFNSSYITHNEGTIQPIPTSLPGAPNVTFTLPAPYSNYTGKVDIQTVQIQGTNMASNTSKSVYLVFKDQVLASNGGAVSNTNWTGTGMYGGIAISSTDISADTTVTVTTGSISAFMYGNSGANNSNQGRVTALRIAGIPNANTPWSTPTGSGHFTVSASGDNVTMGIDSIFETFISRFPNLTSAGTKGSGSVKYTINAEGSASFEKIQSFVVSQAADSGSAGSDGAPGDAGPGVTFTGTWESGNAYNGGSSIKDVVKYDAGSGNQFYIATADHTSTNTTNSGTGIPGHGPWTLFGAQFESVATDVLLAQDSTITRGLVIGNTDGTGSFIRSVDKTTLAKNSGEGFFLSSSGQFSFDNPTQGSFIQMDSAGIEISSSNFHLKEDGNVIMSGNVTADSGNIGGWIVGSTLSATNIVLNPAGPNIQLAGKTTFADNNVDGVYIGTEGIAIGNDNEFTVTNAGAVTATSATITGEINATSGNFSGNLTSTAIITGGTIRTADETSGTGKSVKIDGSNNVLEFHGDLVKYNSSATDIPGRLFVLDDSQILGGASSTGISNSGMPGMKFFGIDANTSTYDGATDAGTTNAKIYGGAYIPYTFGENYTDFNTMLTGHALGVYRGQLGQMKLSDGGDYGQQTPYVYSLAGLTVNTTNASPSSPHNSKGNPTGHGGTSTSGSGANAMMMSFQSNNIISRPNIGFHFPNTNTGISGTGINKPARAVSGGNNIRHPGSRGSGYNYFKNYEFTSIDVGNRAQDQLSAMNNRSRYYQWTDDEDDTLNITKSTGPTSVYFRLEDQYTQAINPAFDGGSGHPNIDGVVRTPQNLSSTLWSNVRYMAYRIRIKTVTNSGSVGVAVKITMRWGSDASTEFFSETIFTGVTSMFTSYANYSAEHSHITTPKWNDTAPVGSDASPSPEAPRVYLKIEGASHQAITVRVDFNENGGTNDTYFYAFGDGNENSRVEDCALKGVDVVNTIEAKNSNVDGIRYTGFFGADHTGLYSRIRSTTGTVYGVYSQTNDTGAVYSIHNEANTGADVYAGYFAGNVRATGHLSYGTTGAISDERLKEDITLVSGSLEIINKLKPSRFKWKSDYKYEMDPSLSGKQDIGLIAQEVEDVLPELIFENSIPEKDFDLDLLKSQQGKYKGKKSSDFHKTFKFVKYDKLVPLLVEAIQEQQKQIEKLTEKIEELEEK